MPAQMRALVDKILEWWNKFTAKQKAVIIGGVAAAVIMLVILVSVLTRSQYTHLCTATTATESAQINQILSEAGLDYQVSNDGMNFSVNVNQESQANLALNANAIHSDTWSITDVTSGGFSTTESDKQRLYVDFLEKKMAGDFIATFDAIKSAKVELNIPDNDGTLLSKSKESSASIVLTLSKPDAFTEDNAAYLARAVATALGNGTTDNIVIMDNAANLLFAGGQEGSSGNATSALSYKSKAEQALKNQVRSVLFGTGLWSTVDIGTNLNVSFAETKNTTHEYYAPEGYTQGLYSHQDNYTAENTAGISGIPGTDANDETTVMTQDNQNSNSTVEENSYDYLPNESITESQNWGAIDYNGSTISVTATHLIVSNQSEYKAADHDGMSWSEYKSSNAAPVAREDDALYAQMRQLVANATGISVDNVALALYDSYYFVDAEGLAIGVTEILQMVIIIAILLLLTFVILRSMRSTRETVEDEAQELSVESLLESQPADSELDNIEMDNGSETKRLVEKFVDENPEAAANLLRNWLSDGVF